ncbi:putative Bro-N domain-containing protein 6 [Diachasmimorpha longicaudata entomopoxvirus]|uniref:Putative Bro-N domain-containing protein 6 n=1 Tax=Diachasmimorpha longicaudata entomopoxvirus TaxID=109981 RepID=A0A7R5WF94_9POXV|nr:putative Bro-N domain-containing protein 6 [Diachasmimorpha longicaudata entomopoxvirus]AKS26385.1 putative Bro-N domain-containing protein 6 [Diachasmimorpha longicaudata entomopoxvirus]
MGVYRAFYHMPDLKTKYEIIVYFDKKEEFWIREREVSLAMGIKHKDSAQKYVFAKDQMTWGQLMVLNEKNKVEVPWSSNEIFINYTGLCGLGSLVSTNPIGSLFKKTFDDTLLPYIINKYHLAYIEKTDRIKTFQIMANQEKSQFDEYRLIVMGKLNDLKNKGEEYKKEIIKIDNALTQLNTEYTQQKNKFDERLAIFTEKIRFLEDGSQNLKAFSDEGLILN